MNKKTLIALTMSAATALTLTACGESAETQPASATVEATDTAAQETITSAEATAADAANEADTLAAQPEGDDPVYNALEAVRAQYPDGIVVDIDREDGTNLFEIDVVVGPEVIETEVDAATGTVNEDDREGDEDDVQLASNLSIQAEEAIDQALEQHPAGAIDEVDLEDDNGNIEWVIQLDDADGNDLAEVRILAN